MNATMTDRGRVGRGCGVALGSVAAVATLFAAAPNATADPGKTKLLFDVAAGAGVSVGSHFSDRIYDPAKGFGPDAQAVSIEDIAGPAAALSLTPAFAWRWFAVGLGFDATYVTSFHEDRGTPSATLLSLSAVAMARSEGAGPAAALSLGWSGAWLPGLPATIDYLEVPPKFLFGPRIGARLGYEWASGFGARTAISYAYHGGADPYEQYEPITVVVQATFVGG